MSIVVPGGVGVGCEGFFGGVRGKAGPGGGVRRTLHAQPDNVDQLLGRLAKPGRRKLAGVDVPGTGDRQGFYHGAAAGSRERHPDL